MQNENQVARSAPSFRSAKNREEEPTAVPRLFRSTDALGATFWQQKVVKTAPRKNTRTAGSGIRRRFFGNILSCTFGLIPKFTIVLVFSPRQRLQAASAKMFAGAAMCGSARGGNSTGAATAIAAPVLWHGDACGRSGVFKRRFVRYGQLLTALGTTGGQHLATVSRGHSQAETVLVDSLPARRLERSFHCHSSILFVL